MKIDTYETTDSVDTRELHNKTVVVIDTLRATSTMVTALDNGCREIIPVAEVEEALEMAKNFDKSTILLGGERNGVLINGFDLSNSPLEYKEEIVKDKTIIMTTTNGTRAVKKASYGSEVLLCSMLNVSSVAEYINKNCSDVVILCAGTEGKFTRNFTIEDILTAGSLIAKIGPSEKNDLSYVSELLYTQNLNNLNKLLINCYHYNYLIKIGFEKDVEYCMREDTINILPKYSNGTIKKHKI